MFGDDDEGVFEAVEVEADDDGGGDGDPLTTLPFMPRVIPTSVADDEDDNGADEEFNALVQEATIMEIRDPEDDEATRPAMNPGAGAMDQDRGLAVDRLMKRLSQQAGELVPFICVDLTEERAVGSIPLGSASPVFRQVVIRLYRGLEDRGDDAPWAAQLLAYMRARNLHAIPQARRGGAIVEERLREMKMTAELLVRGHEGICVALQEDWGDAEPGLARVHMWSSAGRTRPVWDVMARVFGTLHPRAPFWSDARMRGTLAREDNLLAVWDEIHLNFKAHEPRRL